MKAIISGGGSGGHIFPAIAIANTIRSRYPESEILFVGAKGRMEMDKVPDAGYKIVGLPIAGLQRKITLENIWKNLQLPFKVLRSRCMVRGIIRRFNPDIVVGVGGFASEPTLSMASRMGYTTLLQEQNSYAGLTNKTLANSAAAICVAYEGMERFFPSEKIVFTGNPVRANIEQMTTTHKEGCNYFFGDDIFPVVLSMGGSLGARSINEMILNSLEFFRTNRVRLIWQTGSRMFHEAEEAVEKANLRDWVQVFQFITHIDLAYAAADVVISRAGAIAISELCMVGKPAVLIPSPNVAEDHQTKNAMALVKKEAALMVRDEKCGVEGLPLVLNLLRDEERKSRMSQAIRQLAAPKATERIVDQIDRLIATGKGIRQ